MGMVNFNSNISSFISIPEILSQKKLFKDKFSIKGKKYNFKKSYMLFQNSKKTNDPDQWLQSVLSVKDQSEINYLNKWNKVGLNLIKGESGINGGFFPTLNIACLSRIYLISIPSNVKIETPISIVYIGSNNSNTSLFSHRLILISGESSKAQVIERHIGTENSEYFDNTAVSILAKENSELDFYLINENSEKSNFINSIHAEIKDNSSFDFSTVSIGGQFSRVNLGIDINGTKCQCNVKGMSVGKNDQISDFHSRISHNLPDSKSSQLQKILLTDKSHGVFAGKIQVQHGAENTNSDQLCKTLLLSSKSRIDALPILEINNENVKCTHGSTVSDLDDDQMFYLQSRGITQNEAKKLLTIGFVNEMIVDYPTELKSKIINNLNILM